MFKSSFKSGKNLSSREQSFLSIPANANTAFLRIILTVADKSTTLSSASCTYVTELLSLLEMRNRGGNFMLLCSMIIKYRDKWTAREFYRHIIIGYVHTYIKKGKWTLMNSCQRDIEKSSFPTRVTTDWWYLIGNVIITTHGLPCSV